MERPVPPHLEEVAMEGVMNLTRAMVKSFVFSKNDHEQVIEDCPTEFRNAMREEVLTQKAIRPRSYKQGAKIVLEEFEDGSIDCLMPIGTNSAQRGYNENEARQLEKKTKMMARLRKKHAEKHAKHTGAECDTCFWEKMATPAGNGAGAE
jgi:hypothetical protein